jgi:hypothetical protein
LIRKILRFKYFNGLKKFSANKIPAFLIVLLFLISSVSLAYPQSQLLQQNQEKAFVSDNSQFQNNITNVSRSFSQINNNRDTTYLSIIPSSQTVNYGETFSIIVHLDPGEAVRGVQIDLSFNPSLVQAVSVTKADPIWFFLPPVINNTIGEIHGAGVAVFGFNITTPINCFQITFIAQNTAGVSSLTLHDVIIVGPHGSIIPVLNNGEVTVGENLPPVFGSESPVNGSTGNPLSFTWSIPMNDPDGDVFSWWIQCSNGQMNSGSGASNGTKSLALSGLLYSTSYTVWVNATDPSGSGLYTRAWFTFSTFGNVPPFFGSPSPANGSINNPRSFTWNIPINDSDGDTFSWSIQCSNGQMNSGSGASNGTKSLALSGLAYATTYIVWVNATDPLGSGQWTQRWYTFTTKISQPPVFGSSSPANGSTNQPLSLTWTILINDPEGDVFSWWIQCSNGQTSSGSGASNGTKSLALSGLAYSTSYTVWVNATDPGGSGLYTRAWFTFSTLGNIPPVFGSPSPANGSTNQPLSLTWSIPINDPDGDVFSWWIQCSNGQTSSGSGASNGTKSLSLSGLDYSTTYTVWVNATDPGGSGSYTRRWYIFTTKVNTPPNVPSNPSPANGSTGVSINTDLSWTGGDPDSGDTVTYDVYFGTTTSPSIIMHNQTTLVYDPGELSYNIYYWKIKAWDNHGASAMGPLWHFTTINSPPNKPSNPYPTNGSTQVSLNTDLSWSGGDPDDGDFVTYDVYFGSLFPLPKIKSNISGTTCYLSNLNSSTKYYWKIQAWDNHGNTNIGNLWSFTTILDTTPPSLAITQPKIGYRYINISNIQHEKFKLWLYILRWTLIIGPIQVKVTASDSQSGINRVEFYLDNELQSTDYTEPYTWLWDNEEQLFPYRLTIKAYDNQNNFNSLTLRVWKFL